MVYYQLHVHPTVERERKSIDLQLEIVMYIVCVKTFGPLETFDHTAEAECSKCLVLRVVVDLAFGVHGFFLLLTTHFSVSSHFL